MVLQPVRRATSWLRSLVTPIAACGERSQLFQNGSVGRL